MSTKASWTRLEAWWRAWTSRQPFPAQKTHYRIVQNFRLLGATTESPRFWQLMFIRLSTTKKTPKIKVKALGPRTNLLLALKRHSSFGVLGPLKYTGASVQYVPFLAPPVVTKQARRLPSESVRFFKEKWASNDTSPTKITRPRLGTWTFKRITCGLNNKKWAGPRYRSWPRK